jgi:hypothetical protein
MPGAKMKRTVGTKLTRIQGDLAGMLSDIIRYNRLASADYLDPLIRKKIEQDYAALPKAYRDAMKMRPEPAKTK